MREGKRFAGEKRRISELSLILRAGVVDNKNVGSVNSSERGDCCGRGYHGNADRSDSECLQHFPDEENDG